MAGFREFVTGEVLTAANVDDFLAKQAVMKFADAAARNTALGTAVGGSNALREGMVAWLDDTNTVIAYDGSAWATVGGLVAVKSAIFAGTQSASTAAGANFAVTDLSITHEVADASNKLVILAMLGVVANSALRGQTGLAVHDGTNLIGAGTVSSNRTSLTAGGTPSSGTGDFVAVGRSATFVHTPGAGSKTYTVRAVNQSQFTNTVYVNRNEADADNGDSPRGASSLVIMEVKV